MKKIVSSVASMLAITLVLIGLGSCSGANEKQKVKTDAEMLNSSLGEIMAGANEVVSDFSISTNENEVALKATVSEAAFSLAELDSVLVDFALASYMHAEGSKNSDVVDLINDMSKAEMPLVISLEQKDTKFEIKRTGSHLKTLGKENLGSLNRATAAANLAKVVAGVFATQFKSVDATEYSCNFLTDMIDIVVTYPSVEQSPLNKIANPAGALKGQLIDFTNDYFDRFGILRPALGKLYEDLGIAKIRLTYQTPDKKPMAQIYCNIKQDVL